MLAGDLPAAQQLIARANAAGGADPKIAHNVELMASLAKGTNATTYAAPATPAKRRQRCSHPSDRPRDGADGRGPCDDAGRAERYNESDTGAQSARGQACACRSDAIAAHGCGLSFKRAGRRARCSWQRAFSRYARSVNICADGNSNNLHVPAVRRDDASRQKGCKPDDGERNKKVTTHSDHPIIWMPPPRSSSRRMRLRASFAS